MTLGVEDVRLTPQRRAVLDVIGRAEDHPTAADVLARVRHALPGVGAATVYRTLALLVESGQVAELRLGPGSASRYDRTIDHHDHLICDQCGAVEDVRVAVKKAAFATLEATHGFDVTGYDLRVHGRCTACREQAQPQSTPSDDATEPSQRS